MEEQAVAIENGNSATENTSVVAVPSYRAVESNSIYTGFTYNALPCIAGVLYFAVLIFLVILFYRLVRAMEKIAAKLESGITVKNEKSDNSF